MTAQTAVLRQTAALPVGLLGDAERREVVAARRDAVLRELALGHDAPGSGRRSRGRRRPSRGPRPARAPRPAGSCPCAKRPRLPEGVKTTSASAGSLTVPAQAPRRVPARSRPARRRPSRPPRRPAVAEPEAARGSSRSTPGSPGPLPISTSAAMTAWRTSACSGLVMADVIPDAMAMARNAPLIPLRFGRPKEMFEAPQVVFTPSSSCSRRTSAKTCRPAPPMAPMGMTSGSTTMSEAGMPWSAAMRTIFSATAKRTSGSSEMPGLVVRDGHHGGAVLRHQRQHLLQPLVLTGHRVHQRLALVRGQARLQRGHDGGVDGQRQVGQRLHELDGLGQDRGLVRQRDAGVHVEHVRARRHLRVRVGDDGGEVPRPSSPRPASCGRSG